MLPHQPLLQLRGIAKGFRAGIAGCAATMRVLEHVDLDVSAAECVALQGKPGAGKTTLLLCAAGLMRPDRGTVQRRESSSTSETACIVHYVASRNELVWHRAKPTAPTILLVDEECSHAGAPWSSEMEALLERLRCEGGAVVIVGNGDALQRVATRTMHLARGRLFLVSRHPAMDSVPARVAEG
jgi:ABC-type sulfate/molybdate transport systems ATPase subunit